MTNGYTLECIAGLSDKQKSLASYITSLMLKYPMFDDFYKIKYQSLKTICIDVTKSEDPHAMEQMTTDIVELINSKLFEDPDFNNSNPCSIEKVEYFRLTSCSIIIEYLIQGN